MKKYLIYLFTLASTLLIGCDSFRDMSGTAEVNPITVDVYLDITVENISTLKDLTVKFDNYDEVTSAVSICPFRFLFTILISCPSSFTL